MPEPIFSLYVPRRLRAGGGEPARTSDGPVNRVDEPAAEAVAASGCWDEAMAVAEEASEPTCIGANEESPDLMPAVSAAADGEAGCEAAAEGARVAEPLQAAIASAQRLADIRDEAVRLAAVACGKALRHAMLLDPALLARFVDDALSETQARDGAVVRLNPKDVAAAAPLSCDAISDPSIAPGEFAIDASSGTISGDVQERATLLVLSASHASSRR